MKFIQKSTDDIEQALYVQDLGIFLQQMLKAAACPAVVVSAYRESNETILLPISLEAENKVAATVRPYAYYFSLIN